MTPSYCIAVVRVSVEGFDAATAALAKVLGIKKESAAPVLKSAPNVLFAEMDLQQARRVLKALAGVSEKGVKFLVAEGDGGGIPKVQWPAEPIVEGKPLSAYSLRGPGMKCPVCGSHIKADVHIQEVTDSDSGGLPLPDVPQLPRETPPAPAAPQRRSGSSLDIADVERVWRERAGKSGSRSAVPPDQSGRGGEPSGPSKSPSSLLNQVDSDVPSLAPSATGQYDVFVGRSSHPELPALIAEVRGISMEEAGQLAGKTIIPIAKGIDQNRAVEVKKRLELLNLKPKVVPRRKSSGEMPGTSGR